MPQRFKAGTGFRPHSPVARQYCMDGQAVTWFDVKAGTLRCCVLFWPFLAAATSTAAATTATSRCHFPVLYIGFLCCTILSFVRPSTGSVTLGIPAPARQPHNFSGLLPRLLHRRRHASTILSRPTAAGLPAWGAWWHSAARRQLLLHTLTTRSTDMPHPQPASASRVALKCEH